MLDLLNEIILKKLKSLPKNIKVKTIEFVNEVVNELKSITELGEDLEIEIRPKIVDILWEFRRKGIIQFDDTLLTFEKVQDIE